VGEGGGQGEADVIEIDDTEAAEGCEEPRKLSSKSLRQLDSFELRARSR
jgi:hypothetical protein